MGAKSGVAMLVATAHVSCRLRVGAVILGYTRWSSVLGSDPLGNMFALKFSYRPLDGCLRCAAGGALFPPVAIVYYDAWNETT